MINVVINENTNDVSIKDTYRNIILEPRHVNTSAELTIFYTLRGEDDASAENEYQKFLDWTHLDSTCLTLNSFKNLYFGCDTKPNQSVPSFDDFTHIIDEFDKKIETNGVKGEIDFTSFGQINGHFIIEKHTNTTTDTLDANVPMEKALMDKAEQIYNNKFEKYQLVIDIDEETKLSYRMGRNNDGDIEIHCNYKDDGGTHNNLVYTYSPQQAN